MTDQEYAGDILPKEAWQLLTEELEAVLVDVRTPEEWNYVGVPELTAIDKEPVFVPWRNYGAKQPNADFVDKIKTTGVKADAPILFLCRSGQRSKSAAIAMTAAGFSKCYNIATGFEGDLDPSHHRNSVGGWRTDGLPWKQS